MVERRETRFPEVWANGVRVGYRPAINFDNTTTGTATATDNPSEARIDVAWTPDLTQAEVTLFADSLGEVRVSGIYSWYWTSAQAVGTGDKTADFAAGSEEFYACDCTSGAITATLPALSAAIAGRLYRFKKIDSSANALTIDGDSTDTIDGATTQVISFQYDSITVVADSTGSDWLIA